MVKGTLDFPGQRPAAVTARPASGRGAQARRAPRPSLGGGAGAGRAGGGVREKDPTRSKLPVPAENRAAVAQIEAAQRVAARPEAAGRTRGPA